MSKQAARRLNELRNAWFNPPDLIKVVAEVVRLSSTRHSYLGEASVELKQRTLTNLYNQRPHWLVDAHRDLDTAVASAYGWSSDISDDDALAKLLELNLPRAESGDTAEDEEEEEAERTEK